MARKEKNYTQVEIVPENVAILKKLAGDDRRTLKAEVNVLIEQENDRRTKRAVEQPASEDAA